MRPPAGVRLALLVLLTGACAKRAPEPTAPVAASMDLDAAEARATVNTFLALEARANQAADTLLLPGADFIMTGTRVTARPRLAGLNGPGETAVEEASTGLAGSFAWVVVSYRFEGRSPSLNERGRATFVLEKQRAGWRIRHVHSSMVERW